MSKKDTVHSFVSVKYIGNSIAQRYWFTEPKVIMEEAIWKYIEDGDRYIYLVDFNGNPTFLNLDRIDHISVFDNPDCLEKGQL